MHKSFKRIIDKLQPEHMIEERLNIEDLLQGVSSLRNLKQSISTKKLALIDQYSDLINISKRCLMSGSERIINIGKELIKHVIKKY